MLAKSEWVRGVVAMFVGAGLVVMTACSSKKNGDGVACSSDAASGACSCGAGGTTNDPAGCSAVTAHEGVCVAYSTTCACAAFGCIFFPMTADIKCTYLADDNEFSIVAAPTGAHYCVTSDGMCSASPTACVTGETEESSCTSDAAKALLAQDYVAQQSAGGTMVTDCRTALGGDPSSTTPTPTTSSGGSTTTSDTDSGATSTDPSGGTNICTPGPGKCVDGDSTTCRCGTACIQTIVCPGCSYSCVKGCASDADCAGFYSSSENGATPEPLKCTNATSASPTRYCGI